MTKNYDFAGMATVYGVLCGDNRIIEHGAFDQQLGQVVPIVWRHGHQDINNFLGHALLINSDDPAGVRVKAIFNNTPEGRKAKQMVLDRDVNALSIYANQLNEETVQHGDDGTVRMVKYGVIREVSLALAGKNPGALIEEIVKHAEDPFDPELFVLDGVIIHSGHLLDFDQEPEEAETEEIEDVEEPEEPEESEDEESEEDLEHEESEETEEESEDEVEPEEGGDEETEEDAVEHQDEDTVRDVLETLNEDQEALFNVVLHAAATGEKNPTASGDEEGATLQQVYDSLDERQTNVLHYMADQLSQDSNLSQGDDMSQLINIFAQGADEEKNTLSHAQAVSVLQNAVSGRVDSLRKAFENHGDTLAHSITDIENLFPDAKNVDSGGPMLWADREQGWVPMVLNAVRRRPFARIKSMYADISGDDARAKGFVKGNTKVEEVIAALKRVTTPQTIYKLQKLDRDDIIDITDFNVVVWLKQEMRIMLREELARAILVSDGRSGVSNDKIIETNIRPIYNDSSVYTVQVQHHDAGNEKALASLTATETLALIDAVASARQEYQGAGAPYFYATPEVITKMQLVRDADGRRIHDTVGSLAAALRVAGIVEVPVMSGMTKTEQIGPNNFTVEQLGVIVNLNDYVIGADKGGATTFFDDFDLNLNKYEYLIETRVSGALVRPKSALNIELVTADLGAA